MEMKIGKRVAFVDRGTFRGNDSVNLVDEAKKSWSVASGKEFKMNHFSHFLDSLIHFGR